MGVYGTVTRKIHLICSNNKTTVAELEEYVMELRRIGASDMGIVRMDESGMTYSVETPLQLSEAAEEKKGTE